MEFWEKLEREKNRLQLTNTELAEALEVSLRTVHHWLNAERMPIGITQEGALARLKKLRTPR